MRAAALHERPLHLLRLPWLRVYWNIGCFVKSRCELCVASPYFPPVEGTRPPYVLVAVAGLRGPLCPSDISPASGGNPMVGGARRFLDFARNDSGGLGIAVVAFAGVTG